jgi:MFS family permease
VAGPAWVIPPYAQSELGVGARQLGLLLLANAATVVVAQVPIARLAKGRRRVVMMALGACCFAAAFLLVVRARTPRSWSPRSSSRSASACTPPR